MPDEFDSVVADRCRAVDDVPVPDDLWSRVQFKLLAGTSVEDRPAGRNGLSGIDGASSDDGPSDGGEPIELEPVDAGRRTRRRFALKVALAAAAATLLVVVVAAIVPSGSDEIDPVDVPSSTVRPPTTTTVVPPVQGGMWPQSTPEEVLSAQERADAGDPDYTWQLDPDLVDREDYSEDDEFRPVVETSGKIVDRFLREVLGWQAYYRNPFSGTDRIGSFIDFSDQQYIRCAPDRTNPLYPPGDEPGWGELCAPTIDDLNYEAVTLDLLQPARRGRDGVWVVSGWRPSRFAQVHPDVVEAQAREPVEQFLAARIAGAGAEDLVELDSGRTVGYVPLLYASSSGAPYERYEIERIEGPAWPGDSMAFAVRLFADGGATIVEQQVFWTLLPGLRMDDATLENGQPVALTSTSSDGEVSLAAPGSWNVWWPEAAHVADVGVWFGGLWQADEFFGSGERIELVDPVAYDAWCAANGGSPLLAGPADATQIAQRLMADPDFETTAPAATRVGGLDALSMEVALAPDGEACGVGMIEISRWIHGIGWEPGWRLRLYLVDLPDGMSVETLAITVVATENRLDELVAEVQPIIDSIQFHPG